MKITVIEWTLDEWLAQQALIEVYKLPLVITEDIVERIERLEKEVFGNDADAGK